MVLPIDDNRTVAELQEKFNECFPDLKIEFYAGKHHWKEYSSEDTKIDPSMKIGDIRKKHEPGILDIKSWYQTGKVEQDFQKLFGLNVQIYYLKNGKWEQSAADDNLTLKGLQEISLLSTQKNDKGTKPG